MKGKIYKLVCEETQKIYIGSTKNSLKTRLRYHKDKQNVCRSKNFINPKIILIEEVEFEDKKELLKRERYYIENLDCVNYKTPLRTKHEWYLDNKEKCDKLRDEYRRENKEKVNENQRRYRKEKGKINCECGGFYSIQNKARHFKSKKHLAFIQC